MDTFLVKNINSWANVYEWLDFLAIATAKYLPYVLAFSLLIVIVWPGVSRRIRETAAIAIIAGFFARYFVKSLIGFFYVRPRPVSVLGEITPLIEFDSLASFPSGHSLFFFAVATVVFIYNKKIGSLFFIGAILIGFARIFAGVHYPGDILGGAILGILAALPVNWFVHKFVLSDNEQITNNK